MYSNSGVAVVWVVYPLVYCDAQEQVIDTGFAVRSGILQGGSAVDYVEHAPRLACL